MNNPKCLKCESKLGTITDGPIGVGTHRSTWSVALNTLGREHVATQQPAIVQRSGYCHECADVRAAELNNGGKRELVEYDSESFGYIDAASDIDIYVTRASNGRWYLDEDSGYAGDYPSVKHAIHAALRFLERKPLTV
jgi:hypothetical protein